MGGSKQQSNQIKLLLVWWMDGTIILLIQAMHKRHYWCSYRGSREFNMRPNGKQARGIEELQLPFEIMLRRVVTARGFLQRLPTTLTEDRPTPTGPRSLKTEKRNRYVVSSFLNTLQCLWWLLTFWCISYVSGLCTDERTSVSTSWGQTRSPSATPG